MFGQQIYDMYNDFVITYPFANSYLKGLGLSFIIWMLYLELSPQIGGIFFRPDGNGVSKFRFGGVIPMLTHPFQKTTFWYPSNWDLNFIVASNIGALIYSYLTL